MNWYEEKQEAKRQRLEDRADRLRRQGEARAQSGWDRLKAIPFGQPILVGHYSEKGDRSYRRKACSAIDKGYEMKQAAGELDARAAAIGTGGVSSDDPDGVVKLTEQLNERKAKQETMKCANAAWRKAGNKAGRQADGTWVDQPYTFELTNNNANIRRIEQRIAELSANANRETKETEIAGVRLVENAEINRVQLFFPGKPNADVRSTLKSRGFRWSPMEGAWQRHLNGSGVYAAQDVLKSLSKEQAA